MIAACLAVKKKLRILAPWGKALGGTYQGLKQRYMVHRLPFENQKRAAQQTLIACNARADPVESQLIDSNLFTSTCLGIAQQRRMRQQAIPPSLDQEIDIRFADNRFGIKALRLKLTYFRNCGGELGFYRRLDLPCRSNAFSKVWKPFGSEA